MIGNFSKSLIDSFHKSFVNQCYEILVAGHMKLIETPNISCDWQETDISSQFVLCMNNLPITKRYKIDLSTEFQLNKNILHPGDAKKNSRIDIRMMNWSQKEKKSFYIEAKNVCAKNWKKISGTRVDCKNLAKEYLKEGVQRFVGEKYPFGCMVGYVLQGGPETAVEKINEQILPNSFLGKIEEKHTLFNHEYFYSSENMIDQKKMTLKHIFFPFSEN